ncbi:MULTISPECIES: 1,6-anhydro-N-acetylmuramyl-L-alanine amidase AmpD [Acinetobacter]|jgi:AmpD protein|uniref:1,6-anhydro-N-acetylmuramyl-L-alanine amidase AmpD n=1 Tax=Acinetobacter bereziniae TaxID=106648 RepID=A0A8I1DGH5_ACIBZ|nr:MULTISPECIES: 1,6-anhydro-N-acetylmuramyl-L-alanine amidase AmpD [Acinetobacter]MEC8123190.1 1,6-anhydro-N-acetylmuramyl-L-alanine amidase AmpD [Pseudomonadota bacterium]MBI0396536.1 1,6-anhydro-N-acetylmuramyl-L-alanine amidase AmpD [Acinetobacter bereziniae]MBJ8445328.1 1,6-anhydro-N-acetylmuramyl-L-alanine amidase AmpD [Acinetobacter bereziniae]MCM8512852.1 1,6-anhydro-N-acetylmuramyl-L-alanine amidase AmpD [Acinetobacter bereziniae]MDQ9818687.1 1,6-anhydro-N-acetylmuramyl-L-alanine amid
MQSASRFQVVNGQLIGARQVPSPNYNQRPENTEIQLIVIHNISLPPSQFGGGYIEQFFQNQLDWSIHPYFQTIQGMQVSTHLLILRTGEIIQFVNFNDRAWHAGRSSYLGKVECNDYSIGIELEGSDDLDFEEVQYQQLVDVVAALQLAYPKTDHHLAGHSDIAPGRKTDPGTHFEWQRFREGLTQKKFSIEK